VIEHSPIEPHVRTQVYWIHCGTTAEKGSDVFASLQPRAHVPGGLLSCYS